VGGAWSCALPRIAVRAWPAEVFPFSSATLRFFGGFCYYNILSSHLKLILKLALQAFNWIKNQAIW